MFPMVGFAATMIAGERAQEAGANQRSRWTRRLRASVAFRGWIATIAFVSGFARSRGDVVGPRLAALPLMRTGSRSTLTCWTRTARRRAAAVLGVVAREHRPIFGLLFGTVANKLVALFIVLIRGVLVTLPFTPSDPGRDGRSSSAPLGWWWPASRSPVLAFIATTTTVFYSHLKARPMSELLLETDLPNRFARGKVRDTYDLDENLLIVATDRVSAFDVVLPTGIPRKGEVLTRLRRGGSNAWRRWCRTTSSR